MKKGYPRWFKHSFHELSTENVREYEKRLYHENPEPTLRYQRNYRKSHELQIKESNRNYKKNHRTWMIRNCQICGRFLHKFSEKYCAVCGTQKKMNERYHNEEMG